MVFLKYRNTFQQNVLTKGKSINDPARVTMLYY